MIAPMINDTEEVTSVAITQDSAINTMLATNILSVVLRSVWFILSYAPYPL